MSRTISFIAALLAVTCIVIPDACAQSAARSPTQSIGRIEQGVTSPSSRRELAFPYQGIIGQVAVKEGDRVQKGAVLMKQDDRIELKRLEALALEADRSLVINAKQAALENKQVELRRKTELFNRKALSESEFLSAELEVKLAQAEVEVSRHEQKTKVSEKELQEVRVEYMTLKSPIDGIVEKIVQKEGEVADIDKPSIVIVKNDPMYIELKTLPTRVVQSLSSGQELDVRYPGGEWEKARINLIVPVADARADTQTIRLEMPNPQNRSTGLIMDVKIPEVSTTAQRE